MLPLKDDNPTWRRPYVTYGLIVLNVLVFLYELGLGRSLQRFIFYYGVIPAEFTHPTTFRVSPIFPFNLFTSMFLHGGFMHVAGNMLYLWIFGDNVEDAMGRFKFVIFYLLTGVLASFTHILISPTSKIPTIGASGAISGVLGAYFVLYPRARVLTLVPDPFTFGLFYRIIPIPAFLVLGFWFVFQLFYGVLSVPSAGRTGGVAFWAHIGGFVAGMFLIKVFRRRKRPTIDDIFPGL